MGCIVRLAASSDVAFPLEYGRDSRRTRGEIRDSEAAGAVCSPSTGLFCRQARWRSGQAGLALIVDGEVDLV